MAQVILRPIDIYTDGACPGNGTRAGGWMGAGIVARCGEVVREWAVPLGRGTNQKAELLAVKEAITRIKDPGTADVTIYTDSAYAIGCLTQAWKPKVNLELVTDVRAEVSRCGRFRMRKVAGHAGVPENERADELAVQAALSQRTA